MTSSLENTTGHKSEIMDHGDCRLREYILTMAAAMMGQDTSWKEGWKAY